MAKMDVVYHTGFQIIEHPDVKYGRKNADFGQGFYLSDQEEFSRRWGKIRKQEKTYLNRYSMDFTGLSVKCFERNEEWYDYIFNNRAGREDIYAAYDVIIGPIANDTIYNLAGITTSGLLDKEQSFRILSVGPEYTQIVIKTEKAAGVLKFIEAIELPKEELLASRNMLKAEEQDFLEQISTWFEE